MNTLHKLEEIKDSPKRFKYGSKEKKKMNVVSADEADIIKIYQAVQELSSEIEYVRELLQDIKWYQVWKFAGLITAFFKFIKTIEDIMFKD